VKDMKHGARECGWLQHRQGVVGDLRRRAVCTHMNEQCLKKVLVRLQYFRLI